MRSTQALGKSLVAFMALAFLMQPAQAQHLPGDTPPESIASPSDLAPPRETPTGTRVAAPGPSEVLILDLNQTMTTVLERSPTLERVNSRIRQAQYRIDEAYTIVNPTASFTGQYSRVEPPLSIPGVGVISPADNYQFSLNLRQAIFTFGRLKWSTLAAKLQRRMIQEDYRGELNRLLALTAQRYIEALVSQEAVIIAEDNLEAQRANLRTSQLLFDQGVAAKFDVLSNSAAVAKAEQRLIEARTARVNSTARVLSLLDEPLDRPLQLIAIDLRAPGAINLPDAKSRALDSRPDVRSLRWAAEEAKARVKLAKASNNPSLDLQNTTINRNATGFSPGTQNTTAIVLTVPLYDGGLSRAQAEQAQETVNQLANDLEQSERDVVLQVEEVYHQLLDRWQAIGVAEESVRQADEALRVAVLRYQNGISTNVELLDSQATRSQARFDLATARSQYLQSRWSWWQATASEYPTEVPFPQEIRERLNAEGLPLRPVDGPEFSEEATTESLGPLLPTGSTVTPPLEIHGLPAPPDGSGLQPVDPTVPGFSPGPGNPATNEPTVLTTPSTTSPTATPDGSTLNARPANESVPSTISPTVPPNDSTLDAGPANVPVLAPTAPRNPGNQSRPTTVPPTQP